jgi:hypothetical protein
MPNKAKLAGSGVCDALIIWSAMRRLLAIRSTYLVPAFKAELGARSPP